MKSLKNISTALGFGLGLFSLLPMASAKIYLDTVIDPLPLVEIHAVIPKGAFNSDLKNLASADVVEFILASGTKNKTKQQLQDSLAAFGANISMNIGSEFSSVDISFPYIEGKNYDDLFTIFKEAFTEPRFDKATFELSKKKLKNSITGLVDKDASLLLSTIHSWEYFKALKKKPMTIEDVDSLKLADVESFYNDKLVSSEDAWIGCVLPANLKAPFVTRIQGLFAKQGAIVEGEHLQPLIGERQVKVDVKPSKTFFIIDKKERTQNVVAMNVLLDEQLSSSKELEFRFANYVLVGASLGSAFVDVIRTQNGLAYYAQPFESRLMGRSSFGFSTNPVSARALQAFKTIADLVGAYYENSAESFSKFKPELWSSRMQAFRFNEIMDRASEIKKLTRRKLVVLGEISPEYYKADPKKWNVNQKDVASVYSGLYDKSMVVAGAVGDATKLESLVKINFPDFQIIKLSAQEAITAKPYK